MAAKSNTLSFPFLFQLKSTIHYTTQSIQQKYTIQIFYTQCSFFLVGQETSFVVSLLLNYSLSLDKLSDRICYLIE